jgi:hypothetical protein
MGAAQHEPGAQQERDGPAAAPPAVLAAVELGWCMAELYAMVTPAALEPPDAPEEPEEPEARDAPGAPLPKVSAAAETRRIQLQEDLPGLGSLQAAGYMVGRIREILQRLLAQYWPWVMVITLAMVAAVVSSLVLLHSPTWPRPGRRPCSPTPTPTPTPTASCMKRKHRDRPSGSQPADGSSADGSQPAAASAGKPVSDRPPGPG